jgi:hypothetical protein
MKYDIYRFRKVRNLENKQSKKEKLKSKGMANLKEKEVEEKAK